MAPYKMIPGAYERPEQHTGHADFPHSQHTTDKQEERGYGRTPHAPIRSRMSASAHTPILSDSRLGGHIITINIICYRKLEHVKKREHQQNGDIIHFDISPIANRQGRQPTNVRFGHELRRNQTHPRANRGGGALTRVHTAAGWW